MKTIDDMVGGLYGLLAETPEAEAVCLDLYYDEGEDTGWLSLGGVEVRWERDDDGDVSVRVTQEESGDEVPTTARPDDAEGLRDVVLAAARDTALWKDHLVETLHDGLCDWLESQDCYWNEWEDDEICDERVAWQMTWCDVLVRVYWAGGYPLWSVANDPQDERRDGEVDDDALDEVTAAMEECVLIRE